MTYYCEECSVWMRSDDVKMSYHNGKYVEHRWCKYDRRYRAYDQDIQSCRGFVYVGRAVLTKICEILNIEQQSLFEAFDEVKENYIIPCEPDVLIRYNTLASYIVNGLDTYPEKENIAKTMLNSYIIDAEANVKLHNYAKAASIYGEMVKGLKVIFDVINDKSLVKVK